VRRHSGRFNPRSLRMIVSHSSSHLTRLSTRHRPILQTSVKAAMVLALRTSTSTTSPRISTCRPGPLYMPWLTARSASQVRWMVDHRRPSTGRCLFTVRAPQSQPLADGIGIRG
jgi:hypothetical protein